MQRIVKMSCAMAVILLVLLIRNYLNDEMASGLNSKNIFLSNIAFYFVKSIYFSLELTHWDRVTHICVSKITIIGSYNGLSPGRHQAIIWTSVGILLIGPSKTKLHPNLYIFIQENGVWKMVAILSRPQCVNCNLALSHWFIAVLCPRYWQDTGGPSLGQWVQHWGAQGGLLHA